MSREHNHSQDGPQEHPQDDPAARGIDTVAHLVEHLREAVEYPVAVVCVGNELSGDDAAGPAVARKLGSTGVSPVSLFTTGETPVLPTTWQVFDVQTVPESFLMKIVNARPKTVLLVDALDFGGPVGAVEVFTSEAVVGQGPSTHGPAPIAFLDLLHMLHPCRRVILGIQPAHVQFGDPMSPQVSAAVEMVSRAILEVAQASRL